MSDKLSNLDPAAALTGAELVYLVQGGVQKRSTAQDVANLAIAAAATAEFIRDTIATALAASAGISVTPNDGADTITVGLDTETVQDIVGALLAAGSGIAVTYNDAGNVETIAVDTEAVQDIIGALVAAGSGIDVTYNDAGNAETIALNTEAVQDIVGALISASSGVNGGIVVTYNDAGNAETIGLLSSAFQTLTDAATIAWDMSAGYNAKVTLGGNRTSGTPTNPVEGRTYSLELIQDGTGSRTWTPAASMKFGSAGNPTLSTAAGKKDMVYLQCLDSVTPEFRCTFNKDA